jgi:capsular polysaccharide transport system ATP-binding protein
MIDLEDVSVSLKVGNRRTVVFDRLSCQIPTNRRFILLGGHASGKSTLIKLLSGLLRPEAGRVTRLANVSFPVGFAGGFRPTLTVRQNLACIAELYDVEAAEIVDFVARATDLFDLLKEKYGNLPTHFRTKVCYATSYAVPFDTYLIDGHVAVGDETFRERCIRFLEVRSASAGYIISTRNSLVARRYGECGAILKNGEIEFHDTIDDLVQRFDNGQDVRIGPRHRVEAHSD